MSPSTTAEADNRTRRGKRGRGGHRNTAACKNDKPTSTTTEPATSINGEDKYNAVFVPHSNAHIALGAARKQQPSSSARTWASDGLDRTAAPKTAAKSTPSQPSSSVTQPPADPPTSFRAFVIKEKQRLIEKKQALAKTEMDKRKAEPLKFSQSFKLNNDLASILAKDKERVESRKDLERRASAIARFVFGTHDPSPGASWATLLTHDANADTPAEESEDTTAAVCWICTEPVKYYSLSACNHRTCHVCALRLRALYRKFECAFCKEPQATVIFTTLPDADFLSYTADAIPYKDTSLAIFFETQDMMDETLILLRFNCPDTACAYTASGWGDLKLHARAVHGKVLCDLCIQSKKVFAHEHALYPPSVLPLHLPSIPHRPSKRPLMEPIEGGTHPMCEFCRECFFGDEELFVHMRERHEECFLCKQNEIRDQYFQNYESLELHFSQAHFTCTHAVCQAQKFVVFDSEPDLKAHQVETHGEELSSRDKKDPQRVEDAFEFEDTGGGGWTELRGRGGRERSPHIPQAQQRPIRGRREAFVGHLTVMEATQVAQPFVPTGHTSQVREDVDSLAAERYGAFITRLQNVAPNPNNASATVTAAMRGYLANETSALDFISTVGSVLGHNLDETAGIINDVVDLLEEDRKKSNLLAAWNGFKIKQRQQVPSPVPTIIGPGCAGISSGRVPNTTRTAAWGSAQQSSRQMWDWVTEAASASTSRTVPGASASSPPSSSAIQDDHFPPLAGSSSAVTRTPMQIRQPQHHTPWIVASSGSASGSYAAATPATASSASTISPRKKGKGAARRG